MNDQRKQRTANWQLLANFVSTEQADGERALADQLIKAGQRLRIQSQQLEAIHEVMVAALRRATNKARQADGPLTVRVRIWSSAPCDVECGWGFFLVDKDRNEASANGVKEEHVLELFLYQASGSSLKSTS